VQKIINRGLLVVGVATALLGVRGCTKTESSNQAARSALTRLQAAQDEFVTNRKAAESWKDDWHNNKDSLAKKTEFENTVTQQLTQLMFRIKDEVRGFQFSPEAVQEIASFANLKSNDQKSVKQFLDDNLTLISRSGSLKPQEQEALRTVSSELWQLYSNRMGGEKEGTYQLYTLYEKFVDKVIADRIPEDDREKMTAALIKAGKTAIYDNLLKVADEDSSRAFNNGLILTLGLIFLLVGGILTGCTESKNTNRY
jgi:hypothetical protein